MRHLRFNVCAERNDATDRPGAAASGSTFLLAAIQGHHRTIPHARFGGRFAPQMRCKTLQYAKYSCGFAPFCGTNFRANSRALNYAVMPKFRPVLHRWKRRCFPGLKEQHLRRHGSAYMLERPNGRAPMGLFRRRKEAGPPPPQQCGFRRLGAFEKTPGPSRAF